MDYYMTKWPIFWQKHDYKNDLDFEVIWTQIPCFQNGYNQISELHISQILASKYKQY